MLKAFTRRVPACMQLRSYSKSWLLCKRIFLLTLFLGNFGLVSELLRFFEISWGAFYGKITRALWSQLISLSLLFQKN